MTDYLKRYGTNKVAVRKFQMGGDMGAAPVEPGMEPGMAPEAGAPAEGGMDLQAALMEFKESQDPELAVMICNELIKVMEGGAEMGAPAEGGEPVAMASRGAKLKTPMFRKGGRLVARY
jgi:hypothetical protein